MDKIALAYYEGDRILQLFGLLLSLCIPALLLFTGISKRMAELAQRLGKKWVFSIMIHGLMLFTLLYLVNLPIMYLQDFRQANQFGLSNQAFFDWLSGSLYDFVTETVLLVLVLWIPYLLFRKYKKSWHLILTVLVSLYFIASGIVEPMLNSAFSDEYSQLRNPKLMAQIQKLLDQADISDRKVMLQDTGATSTVAGAKVEGIGSSMRIVLTDKLVEQYTVDEIRFVVAHEIGHYKMKHTYQLVALNIALIIILLQLFRLLGNQVISRFGKRLGFKEWQETASLTLIVLIVNLFFVVQTPVMNVYKIVIETQADKYAIEMTRDNTAGVSALTKRGISHLEYSNADALYKLWKYDHLTADERIKICKNYMPWKTNQANKYFRQ